MAADTRGASGPTNTEDRGFHSHDCPVCDSSSHRPRFQARDNLGPESFNLVTCKDCNLTYVDPRPEGDRIEAYYASCYYGNRHRVLKYFLMSLRAWQVGSITGCGKLLDVGCGMGDFLLACRRRGWQVTGVEQGGAPAMAAQDGLGFKIVDPAEMAGLPSASFEVVTVWHVLEHVVDPRDTLKEIRRVLAPGGRLVIEVPNFGSWQARFGRSDWHHLDVPRHLLHFERDPLDRLLREAGFEADSWRTFSLEYDAFGLAQTVLNKVCRRPAIVFQMLIGKPVDGGVFDTVLSLVLALPVLAVSAVVSLFAPVFGQGGVLRVTARMRG